MGVEELQKPMATPCSHSTGKSCSIYDARPESCRSFVCLWLDEASWETRPPQNLLWESERPDLCGVMFHAAGEDFTQTTGFPVVVARGDFVQGKAVLHRLAQRALVILIQDEGRRQLMGTPEALNAARTYLWQEQL